jgi:chromosome segregation ATPase
LSPQRENALTNENKLLKAKHQLYLASAEEKARLEKQVFTLTNVRRTLEDSLRKAKNDILRQKETIQKLTNSVREIGLSQSNSNHRHMKKSKVSEEDITIGKTEKQHKQITHQLFRLQRKINAEEFRLKKGMERLEDIKKKRKVIKESRSTQRKGLRKDRSQREFDDMMEQLIVRVQDQKTELVNLRRKLRKNNLAGERSQSDKKRIQMLNSDLKKTRTKINSLEIELIKAKKNSPRKPASNRDLEAGEKLQFLEKENKELQDQMQKMVPDVIQENRRLMDADIVNWRLALKDLRLEDTSSSGSGLENALQLLHSFFKDFGDKESHKMFESIVEFIHEKHRKLRWLKQVEDEKENSADMIFEDY